MAKKTGISRQRPPKGLSLASRRWYESVAAEYDLGPHHVRLLTAAAESWDDYTTARDALKRCGQTYTDRFDAPRPRPEVTIARDSRAAFITCIRALGLDLQPPTED